MEKKRIEYIDAMRGFTMLLVVMHHVETSCFGGRVPSYNDFFITFRMPLFFFISGWVLYKADTIWNINHTFSFLKKKFMVQIIPTLFFVSIYAYHYNHPYWWERELKYGYWFTLMLFVYFVLYAFYNLVITNKLGRIKPLLLFALGVALFWFTDEFEAKQYVPEDAYWLRIFCVKKWGLFVFFVFGTIVKQYYNQFCQLMDNKYFSALVLLAFTLFAVVNPERTTLVSFLMAVLGIIVVVTFFRKNESMFVRETRIGKVLQTIGRRTLDIYLIHYLVLPRNLNMIGDFFKHNENLTLEIFAALIVALLVVFVCLVISQTLRISPLFRKYLFGVKK